MTVASTNPNWKGDLPPELCHYPGKCWKTLSYVARKTMAVLCKSLGGLGS